MEPVAIALSWAHASRVRIKVIKQYQDVVHMCEWFRSYYDAADIVTGHYIRKFDLPVIMGSLIEWGRPPLSEKKTIDTKSDLIDFQGLSKSQENLGDMLRGQEEKYHMSDSDWRRVSRLTPTGLTKARERALRDVRQHKEMRLIMVERELLKPPKIWSPR